MCYVMGVASRTHVMTITLFVQNAVWGAHLHLQCGVAVVHRCRKMLKVNIQLRAKHARKFYDHAYFCTIEAAITTFSVKK